MSKRIIWSNRDVDVEDYFLLNTYLDDERENLNVSVDGRIIVIADLGLWYGRRQGFKLLGSRISDILSDDSDYIEWYGDGHNIKAIASHHDGTNYYEYRVVREDRNIENLLVAIQMGEKITRKKLNYYTKSLYKDIAKIYRW
jgi:hypothetical protein